MWLSKSFLTHTSVCEFDLRRGVEVSYCNTSGNQLSGALPSITAYSGVVRIHAEVKLATGDIKKVKHSSLRLVGSPRSQLMVTGVTIAFGTVSISEEKRWKVLGNGVCSTH
jgi:hypothetical protein